MPINTNYDMTIGVKLEVNDNFLRIKPANWITLLPERLLLSNNKKTIKGCTRLTMVRPSDVDKGFQFSSLEHVQIR